MSKCAWMAVVDGTLLCVLLCDPCVLGPHCSLQRACAAQSKAFFESLPGPPMRAVVVCVLLCGAR